MTREGTEGSARLARERQMGARMRGQNINSIKCN